MAFAVQNPARQMRTVPVLYGAQGTGKSSRRARCRRSSARNCATIRNEDIKGKFTSHFVTKLFVASARSRPARSRTRPRRSSTSPASRSSSTRRRAAAFYVPNRIKMLCTSNQTLPVALEGEGDTRWVLFKQMERPARLHGAHGVALRPGHEPMEREGPRRALGPRAFLLAFPVDVQLARSVHVNAARASAVEASRSSIEQFIDS
jgi:hypothetical protein